MPTDIPLKAVDPSDAAIELRDAITAAIRQKVGTLSAVELLAALAYTTGQTIALQDARNVTPEMAIRLVERNLEAGNRDAIEQIQAAGGIEAWAKLKEEPDASHP